MQVLMTVSQAGHGLYRRRGDVYDVPEDEALRLVAAGHAKPVDFVETASVVPGGEQRKRRGRPPKKAEMVE